MPIHVKIFCNIQSFQLLNKWMQLPPHTVLPCFFTQIAYNGEQWMNLIYMKLELNFLHFSYMYGPL